MNQSLKMKIQNLLFYLRIRMILKNCAILRTSVSCPTSVELTRAMLTK